MLINQTTEVAVKQPPQDPKLLKSLQGHKDRVTKAIFHPSLKQVISSSNDGLILAWGLRPNARPNKFAGHKGPVTDVAVNDRGTLIASCSRDQTVRIWSNNASAACTTLKGHSAPVKSIAFNSDGSLLVSSGDDKFVKIWDVEKRKFVQSFTGHQNWVRSAQFSLDSRMVASGSDDRTVKLWDVVHASMIHTFVDHSGMVCDVKYHPDGSCLASGSTDKKIKIFDCRARKLLQHYDAHSDAVNSVSFHSNGQYLVSTSNDSTVKIWDLRMGQILYTLFGHEGPSTTATFSPLGDFLLTGGQDQNIVIWNTHLNEHETEELYGIAATRVETDIFITDKAEIKRLPVEIPKLTKKELKEQMEFEAAAAPQFPNQPAQGQHQKPLQAPKSMGAPPNVLGNREMKGPTYRMLRPEVKQTLDKLIYQLDLCRNTLTLLENRITINESRLIEVVDFIKAEDFSYRPMIVKEVIKTTVEMDQNDCHVPHKELSNSVGVHNLTELRRRMEEQMLLKVNEKNKQFKVEDQTWESFRSSTVGGDDVHNEFRNDSDHSYQKKNVDDDEEVPIKAFGKIKNDKPKTGLAAERSGDFSDDGEPEFNIAKELRDSSPRDENYMRTTNVFKTQKFE